MTRTARITLLLSLWLLYTAAVAFAQPAVTEAAFLGGRLHLGLTGRHLQSNSLLEPHTFSPVSGLLPPDPGWERTWSQTDLYATAGFDAIDSEHLLLALGMHLGVSWGRFTAENDRRSFSETWHTRPALLWGPAGRLELRLERASGPFLELRYDLFMAQAEEDRESVSSVSGRPIDPDTRDALFWWTRHEAAAALGWRFQTAWGLVTPQVEARWRYLKLKKRLTHHFPLNDPQDPDINLLRALNAVPSEYRYGLSSRLVPALGVRWRVTDWLSLDAAAVISRDQDFTLSLELSL